MAEEARHYLTDEEWEALRLDEHGPHEPAIAAARSVLEGFLGALSMDNDDPDAFRVFVRNRSNPEPPALRTTWSRVDGWYPVEDADPSVVLQARISVAEYRGEDRPDLPRFATVPLVCRNEAGELEAIPGGAWAVEGWRWGQWKAPDTTN